MLMRVDVSQWVPMSTRDVLDHHNETFGNLELEGCLEDYDDDSVIISHMGAFHGLDEIRGLFEGFFEELDHPDAHFTVHESIVEDNIGYTTWDAESPENVYEFGTDTFLIEDDVIRYQTFGTAVTAKE